MNSHDQAGKPTVDWYDKEEATAAVEGREDRTQLYVTLIGRLFWNTQTDLLKLMNDVRLLGYVLL